jgi:hypothetical protein
MIRCAQPGVIRRGGLNAAGAGKFEASGLDVIPGALIPLVSLAPEPVIGQERVAVGACARVDFARAGLQRSQPFH